MQDKTLVRAHAIRVHDRKCVRRCMLLCVRAREHSHTRLGHARVRVRIFVEACLPLNSGGTRQSPRVVVRAAIHVREGIVAAVPKQPAIQHVQVHCRQIIRRQIFLLHALARATVRREARRGDN